LLLLFLPTGERLGHVDFAIAWHRIAEVLPVADLAAVHEDHHVGADGPLVVEHICPGARVSPKDGIQGLANCFPFNACGRAGDVALNVLSKGYCWHGWMKRKQ
jgi:hypothetical protein